jgi:hypothetical protein
MNCGIAFLIETQQRITPVSVSQLLAGSCLPFRHRPANIHGSRKTSFYWVG